MLPERLSESKKQVEWKDLRNYYRLTSAQQMVDLWHYRVRNGAIAFFLIFCWACMKLCARFRCPDSLWNLGPPPTCVDFLSIIAPNIPRAETEWVWKSVW